MLLRVTGLVLSKGIRKGQSKASGNEYRLAEYRILVANEDLALLTVNELSDDVVPHFAQGELVDLKVDVGVYRDQPNLNYRGEWVDVEPLELATAV